jgi:hypothetical protein
MNKAGRLGLAQIRHGLQPYILPAEQVTTAIFMSSHAALGSAKWPRAT